jgi:FlaG/FlaF family flagellin (archaellin)
VKKGVELRDRRGVSPVIATIIIVSIAIVMSLAVAYWMLGLGGAFTRYEKLEFTSAYVTVAKNETT